MSVALFLRYCRSANSEKLVSIATQQLFDDYWLPIANELQLQWVPLFQTGLPVDVVEIPEIVEELTQLRENILVTKTIPFDIREHADERITRLIKELQKAIEEAPAEIYIG